MSGPATRSQSLERERVSSENNMSERSENNINENLQGTVMDLEDKYRQALADIADLRTLVSNIPRNAPTTTTFSANPFNGKINPTTPNGLKLYQAATGARSEVNKLTSTIAKSKPFLEAMRDDSAKFCWGTMISNIGVNNKNTS